MRTTSVSCLLALLLCATVRIDARPKPDIFSPNTHVRGASMTTARLLQQAIDRSPTFAKLIATLDTTDVIVHVEEVKQLSPGTDGGLLFSVATGGVRYLRAQVVAGLPVNDRISVIAHELQHALEVAGDHSVRNQATFIALYERIGERSHRNHFDTAAARDTGRRVRNEITAN